MLSRHQSSLLSARLFFFLLDSHFDLQSQFLIPTSADTIPKVRFNSANVSIIMPQKTYLLCANLCFLCLAAASYLVFSKVLNLDLFLGKSTDEWDNTEAELKTPKTPKEYFELLSIDPVKSLKYLEFQYVLLTHISMRIKGTKDSFVKV